jgi:iron complex outermembrane receptor protein
VLPHQYNELQNVAINTTKENHTAVIKAELSNRDIEESRGQTLGEMLKKINGVTVLQTGSTIFKPVIHGLHSQRILMLNNGVRQEGQQWGSEHAPEIDPFIADKFTVLKGAGALRYGADAIAGAILVEPRPLPTNQKLAAEINMAYFANNRQWVGHVMLEQNLKNKPHLSWRIHATYKKGGNARTPDYWLHNTGVTELNYSGAVAYKKPRFRTDLFFSSFNTQIGIFSGSHIGNLTDLQNAIQSPKPIQNIDRFTYNIDRPYQQVSHYLLKSKTSFTLANFSKINFTLAHQENIRQEYDRALISNRPELNLNIGTTTADLNWEQEAAGSRQAAAGVQVMRQENIWSGSRFFIPNFISWNYAAFITKKWLKPLWQLETALRYDYRQLTSFRNQNNVLSSNQRNFGNVSASASVSRKINQALRWTTNAALAWRAPQVNELYVNGLHHGTASFEIGDSSLQSEKAYNFSTQLRFERDSTWQAELTVYSNWINDFINLVPITPATLTLRGAYPTFKYIQTNAWLYGADFKIERQFNTHWQAAVKTALLWARNQQTKDWLQQMPANRAEAQITYSFTGKTFQNSYVSPSLLYVFRQGNVPANNPDYLPPPPAYQLLNIEFATTCQLWQKSFTFNLSIHNSLNVRYRDYMNRFRYFNDETGRNIILQVKMRL